MAMISPTSARSPWDGPERPDLTLGARAGFAAGLALPGVVIGFGAAAIVDLPLALALVCLYAAALVLWLGGAGRRALSAFGARPLEAADAPRLVNLVAGISARLGAEPPSLWLLDKDGPNALVGRAGGPALGVTSALLERCTRTELEAVVTHCLLRLERSPRLAREALASCLGTAARPLLPVVGGPEDVAVAALTRYPPALASAIRKAAPERRFAPYWFVAPEPFDEPPEGRADAVASL
jgi:hypothetical protein